MFIHSLTVYDLHELSGQPNIIKLKSHIISQKKSKITLQQSDHTHTYGKATINPGIVDTNEIGASGESDEIPRGSPVISAVND